MNVKIAMNSREKLSELPLNRFYRYVLEPQLTFDKDGASSEGPFSLFSDMPESVLLTMGIDTPLGWMVEAVYSPYDLDNIKLQDVSLIFWVKAACYPYLRSRVWGHCVTLIACVLLKLERRGRGHFGILIKISRCLCTCIFGPWTL